MERTLIILKPDTIARGLMGEIISRFEKVGLKIVGMKMISPTKDELHQHYEGIGKLQTRRGEDVMNVTLASMQRGPVVAMVLEGVESVALVRKLVGATEPKSAQPGTIRGDYSHMSYDHANNEGVGIPNIVHASADTDEAALEVKHWFKESELFMYKAVHEDFTQTRK